VPDPDAVAQVVWDGSFLWWFRWCGRWLLSGLVVPGVVEECVPGEVPWEEVDVVFAGAGFVLFVDVVADQDGDAPVGQLGMASWTAGS
jgi:hypothetical protein